MVEIIPLWLVTALSFATVFSVMTSIGTTITPALFLAHIRSPCLLLRGLLCVLAIVPAAGFAAGFAFGLSPGERVGVALMAIAPGAPLALRRALGSGGDAGFSPTLQITVALLAIVAMPAWVAVGNALLGTNGFVNVADVAKQVGFAQLLPLGVGALMAAFAPARAVRIGALLGKIGAVLLIGMVLGQLLDMHRLILAARPMTMAAAAATTLVALAAGHFLGGPAPQTRHAVAVAGSLRNVGLALLIANANGAKAAVPVAIVTYLLTAFVIVTIYILIRSRWIGRAG